MAEALRRFTQVGERRRAPLDRIDQPRHLALGCDIERGERAHLARQRQRLRQVARILVDGGCAAQPVRPARTLPGAVEQWPGALEVSGARELAGREQHQAGVVRVGGERRLQLLQALGGAVQLFQPEVERLPGCARQPAQAGDARAQIRDRALLLAHFAGGAEVGERRALMGRLQGRCDPVHLRGPGVGAALPVEVGGRGPRLGGMGLAAQHAAQQLEGTRVLARVADQSLRQAQREHRVGYFAFELLLQIGEMLAMRPQDAQQPGLVQAQRECLPGTGAAAPRPSRGLRCRWRRSWRASAAPRSAMRCSGARLARRSHSATASSRR